MIKRILYSLPVVVAMLVLISYLWPESNNSNVTEEGFASFEEIKVSENNFGPVDSNTGFALKTTDGDRLQISSLDSENVRQIAEETYVLNPDGTGFDIIYYDVDGNTTVLLYEEPLVEVRQRAQEYILNNFGLTRTELCLLDVFVATNKYTNVYLADQHLGFSFCPGSLEL